MVHILNQNSKQKKSKVTCHPEAPAHGRRTIITYKFTLIHKISNSEPYNKMVRIFLTVFWKLFRLPTKDLYAKITNNRWILFHLFAIFKLHNSIFIHRSFGKFEWVNIKVTEPRGVTCGYCRTAGIAAEATPSTVCLLPSSYIRNQVVFFNTSLFTVYL